MLNKKLIFSFHSILLFGLFQLTQAQTSSFQLTWDKNLEEDMGSYRIYRGTSPDASTQVGNVQHPDTVYSDGSIENGVLYYYRIKAVDISQNASGYSTEVSAATPKISGLLSELILSADTTIIFDLDELVSDPDDAKDQITWTISGDNLLTVSIANRAATIITPAIWESQEKLTFKAEDNDGFFDSKDIVLRSGDSAPKAPTIDNISDVQLNEDTSETLTLSDFVTDEDTNTDDLVFTINDVDSFSFIIDNDLLTITPAKNWSGSGTATVTVTDETSLSDETSFGITVNPVNDPPVLLNIPQQFFGTDTIITLNLAPFKVDVDNNVTNLVWQFSNPTFVELDFDEITEILTITKPTDWEGTESIIITLTDPLNASFSDTLLVNGFSPDAPSFNTIPNLKIEKNMSKTISLFDYVVDDDTNKEDLIFTINKVDSFTFNIVNDSLTIIPQNNWTGSGIAIVTVTDDADLTDQTAFQIEVISEPTVSMGLDVNVFPVPFQADKHNEITFQNLPLNGKINIYNFLGDPVIKLDVQSTRFSWNVKNNAGKKVSSGLYLYIVKNEKNKKVTSGKIIVVR